MTRNIGPDVPTQWHKNAARWIANADRIGAMTASVSEALLRSLRPVPGERVLDLASGVGDPALRIAALVGTSGAVVATDAVASMLDALRARARAQGLANVETIHAPAEALDVPPASFDAACSRFGVMFFTDAPRALIGMRRAVRADGRLAIAAWSTPERNPYFTLAMEALDAAGAPPVELPPEARTVWKYAAPGLLAEHAIRAGWQQVASEPVRFEMVLPGCRPEELLDAYAELSDKVATRLDGWEPGEREAGREAARTVLATAAAPYARGPDIALPAEALLVTGRA
jgi:SAM-dependent methyltransferase